MVSDVTVNNQGTIQIDVGGGGGTTVTDLALTLGTTVTGGTLIIGSASGELEIGGGGATLTGVNVENNKTLQVDANDTLTLGAGTAITGGAVTDNGTIAVTGAVTFANTTITGGTVLDNGTIDVTAALSLRERPSAAPPAAPASSTTPLPSRSARAASSSVIRQTPTIP